MRVARLVLFTGVAVAVWVAGTVPASAAPMVRSATGADAASITQAVDDFEAEVGADNCPPMSGCRRIVWDGVPDIRSDPAFMPEGQFRAAAGALFSTPGLGVQVSADDDSADNVPTDAFPFDDPDEIQFRAIDGSYDETFEPFSAQRLFTSVGSNVIDTRFVVPATDTAADTNAFGVVFSDVDAAGTTMQFFAPDGSSLGTFPVPALAGAQTFSFLGVIFDAGERIARVRITQGGAALAATVTDVTEGGTADVVTTDNFVFGDPREQAAVPPPGTPPTPPTPVTPPVVVDRTAPALDLDAPNKRSLKKFLKGVKYSVGPNEEAQIDVVLVAKAKAAELARATKDVVLATDSFGFSTGPREGTLKPNKRLIGDAEQFRARVEVEAIDRSGNKGTARRTIKVKD